MNLSQRTLKIAAATVVSILLAQLFHLENAVSAGIIAILSVLDTKKASLLTGLQRLLSTLLALTIATILFRLLGYTVWVFGLYLLCYVPLAYRLKVEAGIAPCSVLVSHLLLEENSSLPWLGNEVSLMAIGAGIAILINLYIPSHEEKINRLKREADDLMKQVLLQFADVLTEKARPESRLDLLEEKLAEAEQTVSMERDNTLKEQSDYDAHYIAMRQQQAQLLRYMWTNIFLVRLPLNENKVLGNLFTHTAQRLHEANPGKYILEEIDRLLKHFRQSDLPQTREEFEHRAILFQMLNDFTRFIQIKRSFSEHYGWRSAEK